MPSRSPISDVDEEELSEGGNGDFHANNNGCVCVRCLCLRICSYFQLELIEVACWLVVSAAVVLAWVCVVIVLDHSWRADCKSCPGILFTNAVAMPVLLIICPPLVAPWFRRCGVDVMLFVAVVCTLYTFFVSEFGDDDCSDSRGHKIHTFAKWSRRAYTLLGLLAFVSAFATNVAVAYANLLFFVSSRVEALLRLPTEHHNATAQEAVACLQAVLHILRQPDLDHTGFLAQLKKFPSNPTDLVSEPYKPVVKFLLELKKTPEGQVDLRSRRTLEQLEGITRYPIEAAPVGAS